MTALRFEQVAGARGGRALFADVSFDLAPGDAALVSGPNGVGKSTLVRIAAGLLAGAAGAVTRVGDVALLTEAHALDPERRLGEALGFWVGNHRALPALDALGLGEMADAPVRILSTGQRRRAAIARILASDASIWLLDEPANGLDTGAVEVVETLIAGHRAAGGIALVATHQPITMIGATSIALGGRP
ncbi:heme ABC exporter ATP-binding protein CcmA [Sphingomonas oligophenolica]|uniref:Heme ABC exporter ATP-binding protein CcmA n=1 Tax=Sphingomonas oligophenolica TaxID=301154 RepID=A0A502CDF1_9SPHN|nr:heme ABC exporter ATP-binding protein CcmA [Sphingomonas oligophenolica]TPG10823.1 heme ABC exporter ATP-binding protein CcmA [Sphingomonas oligophenolica]